MNPVSRWWFSLRPYSFTASLLPAALAAALAVDPALDVSWWTFPLFAAAAVLFHAGTNVLNDYYDYRHGVDGPNDPDPTHAITRGVVSARFMLVSGQVYFTAGVLLGTAIAALRGPAFFLVGLTGAVGAYLYTGARFSLKYRALGDITVFLLMGPALVFLGFWALTGEVAWMPVVASLPVAFLVTLILHGNNMRDIDVDGAAGVDTVARRLGFSRSKGLFLVLLAAAYLLPPVMALVSAVPSVVTIIVFSLPPAVRQALRVRRAEHGGELIDLPIRVAQVHMLFGVLYIAGFLIDGWWM